jgi:hypothetical protein
MHKHCSQQLELKEIQYTTGKVTMFADNATSKGDPALDSGNIHTLLNIG